jgi:hypothetical protein
MRYVVEGTAARTLVVCEGPPAPAPRPRLLDRVREAVRTFKIPETLASPYGADEPVPRMIRVPPNSAFDRTAGSPSLAAAGQRGRSALDPKRISSASHAMKKERYLTKDSPLGLNLNGALKRPLRESEHRHVS